MGASYSKRKDAKRGKIQGRFTALPHSVIMSMEYRALNHAACRLLIDIAAQYRGDNNGALVACSKYLKPLGWRSNDTITKALKELVQGGFLIMTRQGMRPPLSRPSWYALGWLGLDITEGLDMNSRAYQRATFTPLFPMLPKKAHTPVIGAANIKVVPATGVTASLPAPNTGAVMLEKDMSTAPPNGEYIYLPSAPAHLVCEISKAVH
ncbi:hypothetical protein [Methylophilus sp. TWE2]|uniref:hypothetical protein n=1 Tax=Methylophilus sp. TWE2 TaxID=1662285 RepID=UPI0006707F4C|nr:hypothetical protein [Methylophilus sp. TWE2]